jgi:hypothetical protein
MLNYEFEKTLVSISSELWYDWLRDGSRVVKYISIYYRDNIPDHPNIINYGFNFFGLSVKVYRWIK